MHSRYRCQSCIHCTFKQICPGLVNPVLESVTGHGWAWGGFVSFLKTTETKFQLLSFQTPQSLNSFFMWQVIPNTSSEIAQQW